MIAVAVRRCATYSLDTRRPRVLRRCASSLEQPPTAHKTYILYGRFLKELEIFSVFMCILYCCVLACFMCFFTLLFGALVMLLSHLRRLNLDLIDWLIVPPCPGPCTQVTVTCCIRRLHVSSEPRDCDISIGVGWWRTAWGHREQSKRRWTRADEDFPVKYRFMSPCRVYYCTVYVLGNQTRHSVPLHHLSSLYDYKHFHETVIRRGVCTIQILRGL